MRFDILDLKEFYAGKIGQLALELLSERLVERWPSLKDQRLCAIGYGLPYIERIWPEDNATALMPATMGVVPWPEGKETGLPTDQFMFAGFLAATTSARRSQITELAALKATTIWFETPSRLAQSLAEMADILGPRKAVVPRSARKLARWCLSVLSRKPATSPPILMLILNMSGAKR